MEQQIFNTKEIATYLSCSVSSIRALVRNKEIPNFRIGAKLNFNKESIDEWIKIKEKLNSSPMVEENKIKSIRS